MGGDRAFLAVAAAARTQQQHGGQGDPAADGVDHDGTGEVVEFGAEGGCQPGLYAEVLVPGDALEEGIDQADQYGGGQQLRVEFGAFGDAARDDGRNGGGEGQQEEELMFSA
ncbi:hypothetical protein HFRIS_003398 [Herbaspirillum frisingense GSF30]|uniref:Uncharacterized protein n=1 Tax=Herbaspirillum frisingense GSF30 TaxID=864073 RepID=A0AAI9IHM7_9BURK|nr:hypothetical protein HFRIS_003398 [Herbaspirillum frisingense GSF30]